MSKKGMEKRLKIMKKEIDKLENILNKPKLTNLKRSTIKNLKITSTALRVVAPYVLCAGILAGVCKVANLGFPFKSDMVKKYANVMKEIDSLGNIRYEEQYDYYSNEDNVFKIYSKWEKENDGFYSREIKTYQIKKMTEEEILETLSNIDSILDYLSEPLSIVKERSNNISPEEINNEPFYQFVTYDIDKNNWIIRKETFDENGEISLLYVLFSALAGGLTDAVRRAKSGFEFTTSVKKIKEQYNKMDVDELKKKLEIKRSNYNRLTR